MAKKEDALRVLIVDDEKSIRRFLKFELNTAGYKVFEAVDGQSALETSVSSQPDVIILDLGLPDMEGIEVMRQLRARIQIPIIIVSVRDQEKQKVEAFDAGADDYLTKPFGTGELLARLRAVVRRWIPKGQEEIFKTRDLTVDLASRKILMKDQLVLLTPREYAVLRALIFKAGKVVTHQQLFKEVWNRTHSGGRIDHLLRVTMNKLRRKIEPDPNRPTYLLTEPAIGYRLQFED